MEVEEKIANLKKDDLGSLLRFLDNAEIVTYFENSDSYVTMFEELFPKMLDWVPNYKATLNNIYCMNMKTNELSKELLEFLVIIF